MPGDAKWTVYEDEERAYTAHCRKVVITANFNGGYTLQYFEAYGREPQIATASTFDTAKYKARRMFEHQQKFAETVRKEWKKRMPTTPEEAPIGRPEPPKETELGNNSTHASEMAEVAEDQLVAEEESNPT